MLDSSPLQLYTLVVQKSFESQPVARISIKYYKEELKLGQLRRFLESLRQVSLINVVG